MFIQNISCMILDMYEKYQQKNLVSPIKIMLNGDFFFFKNKIHLFIVKFIKF